MVIPSINIVNELEMVLNRILKMFSNESKVKKQKKEGTRNRYNTNRNGLSMVTSIECFRNTDKINP